jgi:hypothetical protein
MTARRSSTSNTARWHSTSIDIFNMPSAFRAIQSGATMASMRASTGSA